MARKGNKKKKSRYNNATRILNKIKRLTKHLEKHPNCKNAQKALAKLK